MTMLKGLALDLIAWYPTRVTGPPGLHHGLGERGRVPDKRSRHPWCNAIELVVQGSGRPTQGVFLGLIGSMHGRMDAEDDFAHELYQGGKQ
jgi:hypothetical protein